MSRRVLIGNHGYGSGSGLRVAQPGRDAGSGNPADLTFDSDWPVVLPILQAGSFNLNGGDNISIGFPDPGYLPHAMFAMNGSAPFGDQAYTPVFPSGWLAFQNVISGRGPSFLKLLIDRGAIRAQYQLNAPNNNSQGWPGSFTIAYAVYRLQAG